MRPRGEFPDLRPRVTGSFFAAWCAMLALGLVLHYCFERSGMVGLALRADLICKVLRLLFSFVVIWGKGWLLHSSVVFQCLKCNCKHRFWTDGA